MSQTFGYDHQFQDEDLVDSAPVVPAVIMDRMRAHNEEVNKALRAGGSGFMVRMSRPMNERKLALVGHMGEFLEAQSGKIRSLVDAQLANPAKFDKALQSLSSNERILVRYAMDTHQPPAAVNLAEIAQMEEGLESDRDVVELMEGSGKDAFEVRAKTDELRRQAVHVPNANTEFFGEL